jgi:hypothetical protein
MDKVHFLQFPNHGKTIGYKVEEVGKELRVYAAVSFTSPHDQFNRRIGRSIVEGRLNCNRQQKHTHTFMVNGEMPTNFEEWRVLEDQVIETVNGTSREQ